MIDPRALRTYLAVCREGSISGAARVLNISQPSVSVTIGQLERALQTSLFQRSRAGIMLTPEGALLRDRAEAMDALLRDASEEIALAREGVRGPLRIGGTPGALVSLLPKAIRQLEAEQGHFTLHVAERPDPDLITLLREGEIEIAFVTTGIEQPPEDIEEKACARDPFALIAGGNGDLPDRISLKDAGHLRWVLPEAQGAFRRQVDALFIAAGVPAPLDVVRCDSLLTTKAIVRDGTRVTILPRGVAAAELSVGVLRAIPILEASFDRSIGVRTRKGARLSRLAQALLDAIEPSIV